MCEAPRIAISVADFGQSIGVGRRKAYEIAREIGVHIDGRLIVPVTSIEKWLDAIRERESA
jgi:hypothetical protein